MAIYFRGSAYQEIKPWWLNLRGAKAPGALTPECFLLLLYAVIFLWYLACCE